ARVAAARQNKSLSRYIADLLEKTCARDEPSRKQAVAALERFLSGPAIRGSASRGKAETRSMPNARMNCFVDTTLLVYPIDPGNRRKQEIAADLLRAIVRDGTLVLSAQSLNELYRVTTDRRSLLTRK